MMPFSKAKARKSTSPPKPKPQDEFLHYYLQNRNPNTLYRHPSPPWNQLGAGRDGIINSSAESEYDWGSCYSSLPSSRSLGCGLFPVPPQHTLPDSPTDLSGMLAEKMSFADQRLRRVVNGEDQRSRDSGFINGSSATTNSSSESPRYHYGERFVPLPRNHDAGSLHRGQRRALPQKQFSLDSAERHYRDWQRRLDAMDDHNSVYSFNTAVDERDSGVDSVVSYMDYNPIYGRTIATYPKENNSVHSTNTRALFEDMYDHDDVMSETASWSPWGSASNTSLASNVRHRQTMHDTIKDLKSNSPPSIPEDVVTKPSQSSETSPRTSSSLKTLVISIWKILKFFISLGSCTLVCLALFNASRSFSCRWNGHQQMELSTLEAVLNANLIGQHLAVKEIIQALGHFYNETSSSGSPLLVLYLLGWVGTGKSMTTNLLKSQFPVTSNTHLFNVPLHFSNGRNNLNILDDVGEHVRRSCGYSMIIFEDIDPEVVSPSASAYLSNFILNLRDNKSLFSNGTIVVITSNAGGKSINKLLLDMATAQGDYSLHSASRDDVAVEDVTQILDQSQIPMYNTLAASKVQSRIVPFLPMTRSHVRQCIVREMAASGASVTPAEVNAILDDLPFFSNNFPIFSKTGCKKVSGKVDLVLGNKHSFLGIG